MECNMANLLRFLQGWSLWLLNNNKANISFIFQNGWIILKGEIENYRPVTFTSAPINKLWRKSSKKTCPGIEIWKEQMVLPWWTLISDAYINEKNYPPLPSLVPCLIFFLLAGLWQTLSYVLLEYVYLSTELLCMVRTVADDSAFVSPFLQVSLIAEHHLFTLAELHYSILIIAILNFSVRWWRNSEVEGTDLRRS